MATTQLVPPTTPPILPGDDKSPHTIHPQTTRPHSIDEYRLSITVNPTHQAFIPGNGPSLFYGLGLDEA